MSSINTEFQTLTADSVKLISATLTSMNEILKDQTEINDQQSKINNLILEAIQEIKIRLNNVDSNVPFIDSKENI